MPKSTGIDCAADQIEEILEQLPFDFSASAVNESISPSTSYLRNSATRTSPSLAPKLANTPNRHQKKRGFFSRYGPTTGIMSASVQGMDKTANESASPFRFNEVSDTDSRNYENYTEKCYSPSVIGAVAFQSLTIQSPVVLNSPISSFSSFTPSRIGKTRQSDNSGASPAHRQVPLTVISSSTHDSGIPLCTPLGKVPISNDFENADNHRTPVYNITDENYHEHHFYSSQGKHATSLSTLSNTPNRFLSPSGRGRTSNYILSPRSSQSRLKVDDFKSFRFSKAMNHLSDCDLILPVPGFAVTNEAMIDLDPPSKANRPYERSSVFNDDSNNTDFVSKEDEGFTALSYANGMDTVEGDGCPVSVISLFQASGRYENIADISAKQKSNSCKSLFNRPSNRSFEKLDALFYDYATDSDTDCNLSDMDETELDNSTFVLGSPDQVRKGGIQMSNQGSTSELGDENDITIKHSVLNHGKNSFLPHGFNSDSNMAHMSSEADLYGLHVIYEGHVSQNSMENLMGNVKSKRSRVILCEDLLQMNRAQSNNSMGSLGLSLDEGQGLCHVHSARDLITPPVVTQERTSPPPIKETKLSLQKY